MTNEALLRKTIQDQLRAIDQKRIDEGIDPIFWDVVDALAKAIEAEFTLTKRSMEDTR